MEPADSQQRTMPSPKPLPPLPGKRRQVKIVTPPPLSSVPATSTAVGNAWRRPLKATELRGRGLPPSPYPEYLLPEDGHGPLETDEGSLYHEGGGDDDDSDQNFKLLKAKFLPQVPSKKKVARLEDEVTTLQNEVATLQKENATLRRQLSSTRVPGSRDRVITQLREENEQLKRATLEQNQQVSHIARTITAVFREYEKANGLPSPGSDRSGDTSSQSHQLADDSGVIQIHKEISSFDEDSESDY